MSAKHPDRRDGHVYVLLAGEGPHEEFVEVEDHRGHGVGVGRDLREGEYRLLEFPDPRLAGDVEKLEAENAVLREALEGLWVTYRREDPDELGLSARKREWDAWRKACAALAQAEGEVSS